MTDVKQISAGFYSSAEAGSQFSWSFKDLRGQHRPKIKTGTRDGVERNEKGVRDGRERRERALFKESEVGGEQDQSSGCVTTAARFPPRAVAEPRQIYTFQRFASSGQKHARRF